MQAILNSNQNLDKKMSIYIHIPFCVSKCTYCDFCSFVTNPQNILTYLDALHTEIDTRATQFKDKIITSIYIGGGTPSILPSGELSKIINHIKTSFNTNNCDSITVEANPNSFDKTLALQLVSAGVNRISFGLQSHNDRLLKLLNRPHSYLDFERAVNIAKQSGITDISADILLGIPTQTMTDLEQTINSIVNLPLTHISAYGLILEPNTPLTLAVHRGEFDEVDEDTANDMYNYTVSALANFGFNRYEISNFAKAGFESKHNLNYWTRGQYLGLGLASHSFVNGYHWQNTTNFTTYLSNPNSSIIDIEKENIATAKLETIMLALRTMSGLNIVEYNKKFNTDCMQEYNATIKELLDAELITIENNILCITDYNLSNSIIAMFA